LLFAWNLELLEHDCVLENLINTRLRVNLIGIVFADS